MTLTESQWLGAAPSDLLTMTNHLHARGDMDARRAFVIECRREADRCSRFPIIWLSIESAGLEDCVNTWATGADSFTHEVPMETRCHILHDVAGNPWRPVDMFDIYERDDKGTMRCRKGVDPTWLTSTVIDITSSLRDNPHDDGGWAALTDALQDAGCDNEDILNHCRGLGRCPTCMGKGRFNEKAFHGGWDEYDCHDCNATGWTLLPKIGKGQHTAHCRVLMMLTENVIA